MTFDSSDGTCFSFISGKILNQPAPASSANTLLNQHLLRQPAPASSSKTCFISQHMFHQPAPVSSASTGFISQHLHHQPAPASSASPRFIRQHQNTKHRRHPGGRLQVNRARPSSSDNPALLPFQQCHSGRSDSSAAVAEVPAVM